MRTRWLYAGAMALLALTSTTALAQGHGRGRGHDKGEPPGQAKKEDRQDEAQFRDQDREYANNWYYHEYRDTRDNRRELPPGLRDRDRLPPGIERQLQRGWVIDRDYRQQLYPVPVVLVRRFAPPPEGCRYVFFGGRIVLVDPGFRVLDMLQLNINLGR